MVTSKSRRQRYKGEKQADERPLKAVPEAAPEQPTPQPEPTAAEAGLRLDMDLNFEMPPMDLLYADGAIPNFPPKTIYPGPALGAHWRKFLMSNPDLKVFNKVMLAAMRVILREWETTAEEAREEMRRVGVPVQPEPGPLLQALRAEYRMVVAEMTAEKD